MEEKESQVKKILRMIVYKEVHSSTWGYSGDLKCILGKFNIVILLELEFLLLLQHSFDLGGEDLTDLRNTNY